MRSYPALDVTWAVRPSEDAVERLLAELDASGPTGVEERPDGLRVFFSTPRARASAAAHLIGTDPSLVCAPVDVADEDWARRNQADLPPVLVGRIQIRSGGDAENPPGVISLVVEPSTGFGTGHHASTRLCLRLLQDLPLAGARVLDVGTGSGILALAASRLGAAGVVAIDHDESAIAAARETFARNGAAGAISIRCLACAALPALPPEELGFDIVLANLTDESLIRAAGVMPAVLGRPGHLVAGGFLLDQEARVVEAYRSHGFDRACRAEEDEWGAAVFTTSPTSSRSR
jgi:ribosomal protein L11 methyltransferase